MKKISLLFLLFSISLFSRAQGTVGQAIVDYNGQDYPCYTVEYPSPANLVEDAFKEKMNQAGNKTSGGARGWLVYRSVLLPVNGQMVMHDLFIKTDRKSRKEDDHSVVYVIATSPGEIPEDKIKKADRSKSAVNIQLSPAGADFLSSSQATVEEKQYQADLLAQQKLVESAEKKLSDLKSDQEKLEKRIKDLQNDLEKNRKDQESQANEIGVQKGKLEEMRNRKTL